MNITRQMSPNINRGRQGQIPDMIVSHITEGSFSGAVSWLTNPASRVSAHFVVARDGRITQLVDIEDTAWANGTRPGNPSDNLWNGHSALERVRTSGLNTNAHSVSIEHEGRFHETQGALTPEQLEATLWLHQYIMKEVRRIYNKDIPLDRNHIVGHSQITPRTRPNCPGRNFPFDEIIRRIKMDEVPDAPPSQGQDFQLHLPLSGHMNAADAISGNNPRNTMQPGMYFTFNTSGDAVNISNKQGVPGSWINNLLNIDQVGYVPQPERNPEPEPEHAYVMEKVSIRYDLAGIHKFDAFRKSGHWYIDNVGPDKISVRVRDVHERMGLSVVWENGTIVIGDAKDCVTHG